MAQIIPPIPYDKPQTSFEWIDWYTKLLSVINSGSFPHNTLTGLQGGGGGDFYHLSSTDYADFQNVVANLDETIDDRVASLLVAGSNVTLTYNDAANTLTIASTGGSGGGSIDDALALSTWL